MGLRLAVAATSWRRGIRIGSRPAPAVESSHCDHEIPPHCPPSLFHKRGLKESPSEAELQVQLLAALEVGKNRQ